MRKVFNFFGGVILGIVLGFIFAGGVVMSIFESMEKTKNEKLIDYGYAKYGLDNRGNISIIILEPEE